MRITALLTLVLATFPAAFTAPVEQSDKASYRRVTDLDAFSYRKPNGDHMTVRFAEYDAPNCLDQFGVGGKHKNWMDYSPTGGLCFNIKHNDTVSIYHERGYLSTMYLYGEPDCKGEKRHETDWSCCQPIDRAWSPYHVRSYRMW